MGLSTNSKDAEFNHASHYCTLNPMQFQQLSKLNGKSPLYLNWYSILASLHIILPAQTQKGGEGEGGRCRGSSQFILVHVSKVLLELELHP
jgi:hypothetical protein